MTSASSEWAQWIFSKITFLKSVRSNEKIEVCQSFLEEIFTKSLHRGGVRVHIEIYDWQLCLLGPSRYVYGVRNLVSNTPIINLFFQQTLDAPSDQSNNSSLTRYDQDHHRIRKRREKSTIILVSIVLIFLLCHMFRFSLKVCIFLPVTGSPPLTRLGPEKNRVKGKPCYRRSILVLKRGFGTFSFQKSTF